LKSGNSNESEDRREQFKQNREAFFAKNPEWRSLNEKRLVLEARIEIQKQFTRDK
jgi:hypothetical protein